MRVARFGTCVLVGPVSVSGTDDSGCFLLEGVRPGAPIFEV
jgi:hypothetical protein